MPTFTPQMLLSSVLKYFTFHGVYNFKYFAKKLYNSIMTRGDKVIAVSNFVKEHIIKNYDDMIYKLSEDRLYFIENNTMLGLS